ncbi:MAG TPA: hypothetical protein VF824_10585 [Thermoanaerobaculia bacterium]
MFFWFVALAAGFADLACGFGNAHVAVPAAVQDAAHARCVVGVAQRLRETWNFDVQRVEVVAIHVFVEDAFDDVAGVAREPVS